jgi:hypothetical protein
MVKPDWNKFRAKFSENPQSNFEWFCYLLFCKEFNKPFGIFRYKNQSGIETNPIITGSEVVGWQAKFYDTTLSSNKDDLIGMITKSKRDYPNITRIIFYTNEEWGQGKTQDDSKITTNDSKPKTDVENLARSLKIDIQWNTASFFESPFVVVNNELIARHFFCLDNSILDIINEKQHHTNTVLSDVGTSIYFNNKIIEIDRNDVIDNIESELTRSKIIILSGVGGCGKTAVIKILYQKLENNIPFYVFKASEFNVRSIDELFSCCNLNKFIIVHEDEKLKVVVIDSAEKILELSNMEPIKEFFSTLIENKWCIIFTTRNTYLQDLNYQFNGIQKIIPANIAIQNLTKNELEILSKEYNFSLPVDVKLLDLIENPFYLNEYLRSYSECEKLDYLKFKNKLWRNLVVKSSPLREQCFLKLAFQIATNNLFYAIPEVGLQVYDAMVRDGILGHETAGYFISHDIYEEWALERVINSEFTNKESNIKFFEKLGESLSIRRSFRNWISENLSLENNSIRTFVEEVTEDNNIKSFWKDEIFISVLLSDYSDNFFIVFKNKLLEADHKLLMRLCFLLRIACKEVDYDYFEHLGVKNTDILSIEYILTKPRGQGWVSIIKFIFENLEKININNISFLFPIIFEWNKKFKKGETTKLSSLLALKYYQSYIAENKYFSNNDKAEENLLQTILFGATEIEDNLNAIFTEILKNKWKHYGDPYYDLIKLLISDLTCSYWTVKALPELVLKLLNLYWERIDVKECWYYSGQGIEQYFNLDNNYLYYFPASAFQTPMHWLLRSSIKEAIDFIISFTNKSVEYFAKSKLGKNEVEVIQLHFDDGTTKRQIICDRLWNMYRGTKVAPDALESIHMALEKFFLEKAKDSDSQILESWLMYLIANSKSASITAIVCSIILAYPDKTFNIAKILFKTKEIFIYDTRRMVYDRTAKTNYSIGYGLNLDHKIHQDERIETCNDNHRKKSLEDIALYYQFFRSEEIDEENASKRQRALWDIFDQFYKELPNKLSETEFDKTWRIYLARMDRRKMNPTTEEKDGQILINFNPDIDPDIKQFSESSIQKRNECLKHSALKMWAIYRMDKNEKYKNYLQYENQPQAVVHEIRDVLEELETSSSSDIHLFNHDIPGHVCAVLLRDYLLSLSEEDKEFCKNIVVAFASLPLLDNYEYQISDGVESSISVLPILLKEFPEERKNIKTILLLTLFDSCQIGSTCEFSDYSKNAICKYLWEINPDEAQSILYGYLLLKPIYDDYFKESGITKTSKSKMIENFLCENEEELNNIIENKINFTKLKDISVLNLSTLKVAFELLPEKVNDSNDNSLAQIVISVFAKKILSLDRDDKIEYKVEHDFLKKYAVLVLNSSEENIDQYLSAIIQNFVPTEHIAALFIEFISAEDRLISIDNFWYVWEKFYPKIVEVIREPKNWYTEKVVKSYLFAENYWRSDAYKWHTFNHSNTRFFLKVSREIGNDPSTLYSICKMINGIGSIYLNDGITWIFNIINAHSEWLNDKQFDMNNIYYLERVTKKYLFLNRDKIRITFQLKHELLTILDFMIEKGSSIGYLLRENVL